MYFKILFYIFTSSTVLFLFNIYLSLFSNWDFIISLTETNVNEEFDYIIVGSGTAGSLIAHHLSARENIKFVILEAGGSGGPLLNPPIISPFLHTTIHDWQYEIEEQNNSCFAMEGRKCKWTSGKIIGGSAKLNNMIHIGNYVDEIVLWLNQKYSKEELQNRLIQLETYDLLVNDLIFKTKLSWNIMRAASELGYSINTTKSRIKFGFDSVKINQKNGARYTTSHAFLNSVSKNSKMISNAFVEKVLYNSKKNKATGILYEQFGKRRKLLAKKGVILCSGSIGTPKLLLLSGIGPRDHLTDLNIEVVKELPVGHNLIDHVTTGVDLIFLNQSLNLEISNLINPINIWKYFYSGVGPWTFPGCEMVGFLKTSDDLVHPDLQFMVLPIGVATDYGVHLRKTIGINENVWKKYFEKGISMNPITITPIVLHPKSKGYIKLRTKDPYDMPIINPNYFSNEDDIDVIIKGIEIIKKIINTEAMKKLGARLNDNIFPGCESLPFDTYQYWKCYIKHLTLSVHHSAGTCKMGDSFEKTSVVDYDFKVIGIDNLYVVDASVFPELPSGNPNAAVALLAEIFSSELLQK